ncbi:sulfotransferase 4A1-like [Mercenaria mercenaria]|uniref:sulfotransferase 4A1-like n=1 Tax=Mercenaria mercenaria TaxID=6596 RepID=UPI001E1D275A|nr:sulfotransferase 4A1-like [Mercenaria mercenaria]
MAQNENSSDAQKPNIKMKRKVYKAIVMMENEIEEIEEMDTREDDVWVCTFPRSGTTLTQEMVYLIQTLDFETAKRMQLDERFPIIDFKDDRYPYFKGIQPIKDMRSPRMIKSHLHHFLLPRQLREGKGRIIYIARNPKDVATSFYKLGVYGSELVEEHKTFDQFIDGFVNGTEYACPWTRHVLEYWERRNDGNILFLKYEEIVRDKPSTIRQIADFLGRELSSKDVDRIVEHCHVDNMRNNPMVNGSYWNDFKHMNFQSDWRFINQGRPGTWHEKLTPEQSKMIDSLIKVTEKSGLFFEQT